MSVVHNFILILLLSLLARNKYIIRKKVISYHSNVAISGVCSLSSSWLYWTVMLTRLHFFPWTLDRDLQNLHINYFHNFWCESKVFYYSMMRLVSFFFVGVTMQKLQNQCNFLFNILNIAYLNYSTFVL